MLKLTRMSEFIKADFHGFTVKNGFWYGMDTETKKFAVTSGWECGDCLAVYFKNGNDWEMKWVDLDETDFDLENIPQVDIDGKMPFGEWLEEVIGVSQEYFDNNYDGDSEYEEYNEYLYDGLPKFVRSYLAEHENC